MTSDEWDLVVDLVVDVVVDVAEIARREHGELSALVAFCTSTPMGCRCWLRSGAPGV